MRIAIPLFISCLALIFTGCNPKPIPQTFQPNNMTILELHQNWQFARDSSDYWQPAEVPGCVHTDLLRNGRIQDPFYRTNEKDQQWVDKSDWIYETEFDLTAAVLTKNNIVLDFKGLDTYADVYLNDSLLLQADNFFHNWEVDVKGLVQAEKNKLRIFFHSPIKIGLEKLDQHGYPLPASNDQSENGGLGDKRVSIFLRKPGYHFGWDWGPRLVTSGIWAPIELKAWNTARIVDFHIEQKNINKEIANLVAHLEIEADEFSEVILELKNGRTPMDKLGVDLKKGINKVSVPVRISNPELWWTFELGKPHLYEIAAELTMDRQLVDKKLEKIGLRTIEIVRQKDKDGTSFYFKLNDKEVFMKGVNYIPNDIFISRVPNSTYERVIQSAVDANMNMIRVWGGGFYEKELFYDLCDEKGLLVWQDFMFACSMYPGDEAFLKQVEQEAIYNVKRLRNHPSIALWCGNNEIDVAWANYKPESGWGWKQRYDEQQRKDIWQDYEAVFHELLPKVVEEYAPDTYYWPSSPYDGEGTHASYTSKDGDMHYWGVWHGEHPFEDFRNHVARFMSEYGFQSFPEFKTVKKYTIPEDWDIESEVMAAHQRSGIGNLRIRAYMEDHYKIPDAFEDLLYVGQVLQAEGMKTGIEAHRIAKPYCMGSLYWQLNDCWPVASWSSMDYYLNWKALHYFVRDAFKPMVIALEPSGDSLVQVHVISDKQEPIASTVHVYLKDFNGRTTWEDILTFDLAANASKMIGSIDLNGSFMDGIDKRKHLLFFQFHGPEDMADEAYYYFHPIKDLDLPDNPKIEIDFEEKEGRPFFRFQTKTLVKNLFLYFEQQEGHFSDNYFDLMPGTIKEVYFTPNDPTQKVIGSEVQWKSIRGTY